MFVDEGWFGAWSNKLFLADYKVIHFIHISHAIFPTTRPSVQWNWGYTQANLFSTCLYTLYNLDTGCCDNVQASNNDISHTRTVVLFFIFFFFFFTVIQISFSLQSIILPIHFYNRSSIFYSLHQKFRSFKFLNTRMVKFRNLRFLEYSSFQVFKFTN